LIQHNTCFTVIRFIRMYLTGWNLPWRCWLWS